MLRLLLLAAITLVPSYAAAFCGFYVAGSDAKLTADATQVVLMRYGTKTVVSMQNSYDGPPEDFAMVVPVPQVLREKNVKTLPADLFSRIDTLTAPRLVEYWEQDPCPQPNSYEFDSDDSEMAPTADKQSIQLFTKRSKKPKVKVEAKFSVAEYDIVVLSATESTALETWLQQNDYKIPAGAEPYLRPYVEQGMYFFVARVDVEKVARNAGGRAVLSPLRFQYENPDFFLPVRLGMINSSGKQDLIVYTIGYERRFEVANRPNLFIATNLEVKNEVRDNFPAYYEAVFARTLSQKPGAVVTEYSWGTSKCDPCPGPTLSPQDVLTFGADIMPSNLNAWSWVVTRLHARYGADEVGEDLVFTNAPPIVGGRELRDADGALEQGARQEKENTFQGRYVIRHEWDGPAECENPQFGRWGGPPHGGGQGVTGAPSANTRGEAPPTEVAVNVDDMTKDAFPISRVIASRKVKMPRPGKGGGSMCAGCATTSSRAEAAFLGLLFTFVALRRRRCRD